MKLDLTKEILNLENEPIKRPDKKNGEVNVTLQYAVCEALLANFIDEKIDSDEKIKRFKLALKINENPKEVNLKAEEIILIKTLVGKAWTPGVIGRLSQELGEI